jgi:hypothetical protein
VISLSLSGGGFVKRIPLVFVLAAAACSSSQGPKAPPPAASVAPSPTPGVLSRIDPNVIEETDTYVIRRLPKSQYIKVDATHIRLPIVQKPIEFFKEDENYYYTSTPKYPADETALKEQQRKTQKEAAAPSGSQQEPVVPLADFEDLNPPVGASRIRLVPVEATGLPEKGMWRASFVLDDINGDRIPDVIAPPARLGDGRLKVWIGDGKGKFAEWPLSFTENGKPDDRFFIDYGGVAVGDIDGDGKKDVVAASHGGGLVSLFGDGKGGFRVERAGLPQKDFSSQAVVLLDADSDGKLDIAASSDVPGNTAGPPDKRMVRIYLFRGLPKGWEFKPDGLVGGFFSYSLSTWDYDGDGRKDVLTGANNSGAWTLLWKNEGNGTFPPVTFDLIEPYSFHFATTSGTFGPGRAATMVDSFTKGIAQPERIRANGISLYTFENGTWTRQRVWRKKQPKGNVLAIAMGDLDGDRLDDIVFGDDENRRIRTLFQQPDGSFVEPPPASEPAMDSPGQHLRLADLDGDGRLDIVISRTISSADPTNPGGFRVYLNKP